MSSEKLQLIGPFYLATPKRQVRIDAGVRLKASVNAMQSP